MAPVRWRIERTVRTQHGHGVAVRTVRNSRPDRVDRVTAIKDVIRVPIGDDDAARGAVDQFVFFALFRVSNNR